jgi:hypothetical protein
VTILGSATYTQAWDLAGIEIAVPQAFESVQTLVEVFEGWQAPQAPHCQFSVHVTTVQDWLAAGLKAVVPQAFESVQLLVWSPALHEFHAPQLQLSEQLLPPQVCETWQNVFEAVNPSQLLIVSTVA